MSGRRGFDQFLADVAPFFYRRPITYVDIGAYDGRVFGKLLHSNLAVHEAHLVEPNEKYLNLARSVGAELFRGRSVDYYQVAVGAAPGRVRMHDSRTMTKVVGPADGYGSESGPDEQTFEADCTTLDELAERFTERRISLLKIDVEGYEMEVLAGATNVLKHQRVDVLYIEAGMNPEGTQQSYYRRIEDELARYGYRMFRIYEQKHEWLEDSPILRRTNISFLSRKFAQSNPYRVTRELYKANRELEMLHDDIDKKAMLNADLEKEVDETRTRLGTAEKDLEQVATSRDELTAELHSLKRSFELQQGKLKAAEAAKWRSDKRLREAFDCIAALHGRESDVRRQLSVARAEEARVRASFSYRLGALLVQYGRSPRRWIKAPLALARELVRQRRRMRSATGVSAAEDVATVITLTGNHAKWVPLTRKPQLVRVACPRGEADLWITALMAEAGGRVTVTAQKVRSDQSTGNEAAPVDQLQRLRGLMIRNLTLKTGIPVRIIESASGNFTLKLVREEGRFCVVNLEMRPTQTPREMRPGDHRDQSDLAALQPSAAVSAPLSRDDRASSAQSATPATAKTDAEPISDDEELAWEFPAAKLEAKLWGGYARYAIPALERLKSNKAVSLSERRSAAWHLTQWFYAEENYERSLENIEFVKQLGEEEQAYFALAEAQTLIALKRYGEADAVLKRGFRKHKKMDFNLLRSTVVRNLELERSGSRANADKTQLDLLNELYVSVGLAPLRKKREEAPLHLSNITADARPTRGNQPLKVSVIVPAYNAGEMLEWVVGSLLDQTWRNLEVVVVDDCSTDDTRAVVERIARRDGRVQLVTLKNNSGAYPARNAGLSHASGDLVTVHDSDDWSHPQRIELQVAALESSDGLVATMSQWVRVNEELEVIGSWITKGTLVDVNFSSLLFRREVLDIVGAWDDVLVSGDAEFFSRLKRIFGKDSIVKLPRDKLLALSLTRESSLTRSKSTHVRSLNYGLRRNYRHSYRAWHDRLTGDSGELPFDPKRSPRPFPVPPGNRPSSRQQSPNYDVVVISDLAMPGGAFVSTLNYVIAACKAGKRTAVFHWPRFDLATDARPQPRLYAACAEYGVDILGPGDIVDAELVLFGYPVILQYRIEPMPEIRAKQLGIVVNQFASRLVDGGDQQYDPLRVREHLRQIFGMEGVWIPISNWVKRLMEEDRRYPVPHAKPWNPMIDADAWCTAPIRWRGVERPRPVVGRHGRDAYTKWPSDPDALAHAYGVGQEWDVRFLGGAQHAIDTLGGRPGNWEILPFDEVTAEDFLRDLDFYVHYPHEKYIEEFGRGVMEAMAMGIPAILPPQFKETFGKAALYALPSEVPGVISELWRSRDMYLGRARAGRSFVLENCSLSVFPDRLAALPGSVEGDPAERQPPVADLSATAGR